MGIHSLNRLLKTVCSTGIQKINLSSISGKTIVIDTSIYMYRFKIENCLIENFYLLCSIFKKHDITPIFCFDGKPGKEKNTELEKRRNEKRNAEKEYNKLSNILKKEKDETEVLKLEENLDILRKKFIKITKDDIHQVKELFDAYGVQYVTAEK